METRSERNSTSRNMSTREVTRSAFPSKRCVLREKSASGHGEIVKRRGVLDIMARKAKVSLYRFTRTKLTFLFSSFRNDLFFKKSLVSRGSRATMRRKTVSFDDSRSETEAQKFRDAWDKTDRGSGGSVIMYKKFHRFLQTGIENQPCV